MKGLVVIDRSLKTLDVRARSGYADHMTSIEEYNNLCKHLVAEARYAAAFSGLWMRLEDVVTEYIADASYGHLGWIMRHTRSPVSLAHLCEAPTWRLSARRSLMSDCLREMARDV